jgi:hypothetical protein
VRIDLEGRPVNERFRTAGLRLDGVCQRCGWFSPPPDSSRARSPPKTVSRWAKEGKLPFLKALAGTDAIRRPRSRDSSTSSSKSQPPEPPASLPRSPPPP